MYIYTYAYIYQSRKPLKLYQGAVGTAPERFQMTPFFMTMAHIR